MQENKLKLDHWTYGLLWLWLSFIEGNEMFAEI